jgi:hypothetical protein
VTYIIYWNREFCVYLRPKHNEFSYRLWVLWIFFQLDYAGMSVHTNIILNDFCRLGMFSKYDEFWSDQAAEIIKLKWSLHSWEYLQVSEKSLSCSRNEHSEFLWLFRIYSPHFSFKFLIFDEKIYMSKSLGKKIL